MPNKTQDTKTGYLQPPKYIDEGPNKGKNTPYGAKSKKSQLYFQNQSCLSTLVGPKNVLILSTPSKNDYKAQNGKQTPQTSNLNFFSFKFLEFSISPTSNFFNFNPLQLQSYSISNFIDLKLLQLQTSSSKTSNFFI